MARGGTQGGLNCLTHALPRCLPTPTEEADGNGYGVIAGRRGPSRPPPRASVNLVPLLLTGVRLHPPGRTDKHLCRCFGAPATHARRPHGRVFPDHLIKTQGSNTHDTGYRHHLNKEWHAHITARFTWEQKAGGTVRTARSARDHTGTRAGSNGRRWPNGLRLLPGRPTASRNRVARGGTQGGLNCLTHALPRCLPTPTEEADGNGYGVITGRSDPLGRRLE